MLTLGQIENSEYNLLGAMSEDDFLQALELSGPNDKKKLFRKMQKRRLGRLHLPVTCTQPIISKHP